MTIYNIVKIDSSGSAIVHTYIDTLNYIKDGLSLITNLENPEA